MGRKSKPVEKKPLVGGTGEPFESGREVASAGIGMVVGALAAGFAVGLAVWAVFRASSFLTALVWGAARGAAAEALEGAGVPSWWLPIAICTLGGLVIGLWTRFMGGAPEPLEKVMGAVKATGDYRLERPLASVVGFFLPLAFGGSIGPEAGLTGIIAAACGRIGVMLRAAGLRVKALADVTVSATLSAVFATPLAGIVATAVDGMPVQANACDYDLRRSVKLVLYTASALGAAAGIAVFTAVFGSQGGLPRFGGIVPDDANLLWAVPCLLVGYAGALLFHCGEHGFRRLSAAMGHRPILKPVLAGLVLGTLAVPLPYVLFAGEEQAFELIEGWQAFGPLVLVATGLVKCLATPLCLSFGWQGGHFFPCIFAGIAAGYGIAALSGVDPMFCVALTTAALLGAVQQKPLMALALLLLCFPVKSIVWMGIACLVGAALPMPFVCKAHRTTDPERE